LDKVALALITDIKVGVSILQHKVLHGSSLGYWHVDQGLRPWEATQDYQNKQ
jgi:hypothetical protein